MYRFARRIAASAVVLAFFFNLVAVTEAGVVVPTQHNDNFRTGANPAETQLTPANVGRLQRVDRYVDGPINTQVLYAPGVQKTVRGTRNVAFVTTSSNSVYAFDANDTSKALQGGLLWRTTLTDPDRKARPWRRGINATPVLEYDASSGSGTIDVLFSTANQFPWNSIFVKDELALQKTLDVRYYLVKLNLATGKIVLGPVALEGSVARVGSAPLKFAARDESDTASLLLDHGYIYASFSARQNENVSQYYGWMLRYTADGLKYAGAFNTEPHAWEWTGPGHPQRNPQSTFPICYNPAGGRLEPWGPWVTTPGSSMACVGEGGGIWQGGAGPAADRDGNVYAVIGNGRFDPSNDSYGDSIVKLRSGPVVSGLADSFAVTAWFGPPEAADDEAYDVDLGSAGPLVVDGAKRVIAGGKTGFFYVVDDALAMKQQVLAGINNRAPDPDGKLRYRTWNQGPHLHGSPTIWQVSPDLAYVYEWAEKDYLKKYAFDLRNGSFVVKDPWYPWVATETDVLASRCDLLLCLNAMPGGMLAISANGMTPGTGIVWAILTKYDLFSHAAIYAFDADTLKLLWDDPIGAVPHFAGPTVADGHVFVPTNALRSRFSIYSLSAAQVRSQRRTLAPHPWRWEAEMMTTTMKKAPMNDAVPDYAQHPAYRTRMTLPGIVNQLPAGLIATAAYAVRGRETFKCVKGDWAACHRVSTKLDLAYDYDDRTESVGGPVRFAAPQTYTTPAAAVPWPLAPDWQLLAHPGGLFRSAPYVLRVQTSFRKLILKPSSGRNDVPFDAIYVTLAPGG
ncbi:MAG: hypothetical protein JO036_12675 [Candidatus Eremiobacteraeota bacterium]|nr:hypothetical protein [Candidatus Eremiobacteraeota bacterium]